MPSRCCVSSGPSGCCRWLFTARNVGEGEGVELCEALSWSHLQQPSGAGLIPGDLAHGAHGGDVASPSAGAVGAASGTSSTQHGEGTGCGHLALSLLPFVFLPLPGHAAH